jgi:hypothetical protein
VKACTLRNSFYLFHLFKVKHGLSKKGLAQLFFFISFLSEKGSFLPKKGLPATKQDGLRFKFKN